MTTPAGSPVGVTHSRLGRLAAVTRKNARPSRHSCEQDFTAMSRVGRQGRELPMRAALVGAVLGTTA